MLIYIPELRGHLIKTQDLFERYIKALNYYPKVKMLVVKYMSYRHSSFD